MRHGSYLSQRCPQRIHARNDAELRDQRQRQHQAQQHMPRRKHMRRSIGKTAVEQGTDQEDDSGDQTDPVQLSQRTSDNIAGKMTRRAEQKTP